jgi:hypothetical protein
MFGKKNNRRYRMVVEGTTTNPHYIIEKKVDLFLWKWWTRNYLWGNEKFFHTREVTSAKKIVNILNGKENKL